MDCDAHDAPEPPLDPAGGCPALHVDTATPIVQDGGSRAVSGQAPGLHPSSPPDAATTIAHGLVAAGSDATGDTPATSGNGLASFFSRLDARANRPRPSASPGCVACLKNDGNQTHSCKKQKTFTRGVVTDRSSRSRRGGMPHITPEKTPAPPPSNDARDASGPRKRAARAKVRTGDANPPACALMTVLCYYSVHKRSFISQASLHLDGRFEPLAACEEDPLQKDAQSDSRPAGAPVRQGLEHKFYVITHNTVTGL